MASDVIKWGLILGGGYLVYRYLMGTPVATTPTTTTTTTVPPATPPPPPTGTLVQLLATAAAPATSLNADQWAYYYNQLPGKTTIPADIFTALFFPTGRPTDATQNPMYSAADFTAKIATKGLSGLGAVVLHPPLMMLRRRRA